MGGKYNYKNKIIYRKNFEQDIEKFNQILQHKNNDFKNWENSGGMANIMARKQVYKQPVKLSFFLKKNKTNNTIQMLNTKFGIFAVIYFEIMLITDTQTHLKSIQ